MIWSCRVRAVVAAVLLLISLIGCSQRASTRDDLRYALTAAHSAIVSCLAALDAYQRGRSTRAATETVLDDMSAEIADAQRQLERVGIGADVDRMERDMTAAVLDAGATAVLDARDGLQLHGDTTGTRAALQAAGVDVDRLLQQLGKGR
jgi:fatty acid/phospholipid biosynthesis enzyme